MPKFKHRLRRSVDLAKELPKRLKERVARTPSSTKKGKQPEMTLPGLLRLSFELRMQIYLHLFPGWDVEPQSGYAANCSPNRPQHLDPFLHPGIGLILANHQLLNEVVGYFYVNSGLSFARPSQGLLFLTLTQFRLSQLSYLDITVPAFETRSLESISRLLVDNGVALSTLFLRLSPTFPGRISYPVPRYIIPRYAYELPPIHNHLYTSSPRYPYVRTHSVTAIESVRACDSCLGKLQGVRHLTIRGQPEFDNDFEISILKLYLGMVQTAHREGTQVVLSKDNGSKGHEYYFEAWIGSVEAGLAS